MSTWGECHFLDVGQGSSNVVLLGGGHAIVIDCPQGAHCSPLPTIRLLQQCNVSFIDVLVVTHNDDDHHAGMSDILTKYSGAIGQAFFVQDRNVSDMPFERLLLKEVREGKLRPNQLTRLEVVAGRSKRIWRDKRHDLSLHVLYPDVAGNLAAQENNTPNATSAVLVLKGPSWNILFSGDCEVAGWQAIHGWRHGRKLKCEVAAIPHHGGLLGPQKTVAGKPVFKWLYEDVLEVKTAVVSVGTYNTYKHPRKDCIQAIRDSGAHVLCTQMTKVCCRRIESMRPGLLPPGPFAWSSFGRYKTSGGQPMNIACAGSVVSELSDAQVTTPVLAQHTLAVNGSKAIRPVCR